ncbi:MAG: dihydroorotase [Candidatus Acetothermia bacterium]
MDTKLVCNNVLYQGKFTPLEVGITGGKISGVGRSLGSATRTIDLEDKLLLPGIIDGHVHFRDPGNPEKEDFRSGSEAAARGGITTVVDMPNNKPPIKTPELFRDKREMAKKKSLVNFALYAGIPKNLSLIADIVNEGAIGLKLYMAQEEVDLRGLYAKIRDHNTLLTVHAEAPEYINPEGERLTSPTEYVNSRPPIAEIEGVKRLLADNGARLHIAHATLAETVKTVEGAATTEVTPHHLLLSKDEVDLGDFTAVMNPPLRTTGEREGLASLLPGEVDLIASDHAPHLKRQKRTSDPAVGSPGLPGVETILPLSLTYADRAGIPLPRVIDKLTINPARLFGFSNRGEIEAGNWADLTVVNPDVQSRVTGQDFFSKAKITPFEGWEVSYRPELTIVNGEVVYRDGELTGTSGGVFLSGDGENSGQ